MQNPDSQSFETQATRPAEPVGRLLAASDRWLFDAPRRVFYSLVFGVMVLQNGVWPVPIAGRICHLASDLTRQLTQDNRYFDYLYTSCLGLLVGHWTGAWRSTLLFALLHLAILCAGIAGLLWVIHRKFGERTARLFALTFATVPLSNDLLIGLGMPDVYVFIFSTGIVLADGTFLIGALAFLLGLSHFEQGMIIAVGLSVCKSYLVLLRKRPWREAVAPVMSLLGGAIGARLLMAWYFAKHGFHFATTRVSFLLEGHWLSLLSSDLRHFGTLIFSLHNCYWLVVLGWILSLWKPRRRFALTIMAVQVALLGIAMITIDETRVFCLLAWPFLIFLLRPDVVPTELSRGYVVPAYLVGLIIPRLVVYDGSIHSSALYSGLSLLLRLASGHGMPTSADWLGEPFK